MTFEIDANGILSVTAKDKGTGKEQNIRIEASTGLTDAEINKMKEEAQANEQADKEARPRLPQHLRMAKPKGNTVYFWRYAKDYSLPR